MRRATLVLVGALVAAGSDPAPAPRARATAAAVYDSVGWRRATPPWTFTFPRDHASHPAFRTEWWYYTGHLRGGGRDLGYQLTFFRVGIDRGRAASRSRWAPHTFYFAHLALSDVGGRRYHRAQAIQRPALGLAGADSTRYRVWIGGWSAGLEADGRTHALRAATPEFGLALDVRPDKPPVAHGRNGVSRKASGAGQASHYYSLTRLETRGHVRAGGDSFAVAGTSWMDHEFSTSALAADQVGWDWFGLQLDDGRELMLYLMRRRDGTHDPVSSGTLVERDGTARHLTRDAFAVASGGGWTSPRSGARYPTRWRVRVPGEGLDLTVESRLADQEQSEAGGGLAYWEGAVRVRGIARGAAVTGRGYVELTGYAGALPGL